MRERARRIARIPAGPRKIPCARAGGARAATRRRAARARGRATPLRAAPRSTRSVHMFSVRRISSNRCGVPRGADRIETFSSPSRPATTLQADPRRCSAVQIEPPGLGFPKARIASAASRARLSNSPSRSGDAASSVELTSSVDRSGATGSGASASSGACGGGDGWMKIASCSRIALASRSRRSVSRGVCFSCTTRLACSATCRSTSRWRSSSCATGLQTSSTNRAAVNIG